MATKKSKQSKIIYREKLLSIAQQNKSAIVIDIDSVTSVHIQSIRKELRGRAQLLFGKNSYMRKILLDNVTLNKHFEVLAKQLKGNCGLIFTNEPPKALCRHIENSKVQTRAKVGVIAPNDVKVPAGGTGMMPDMTSFFQTLNIPTRIVKGQIEIVSDVFF